MRKLFYDIKILENPDVVREVENHMSDKQREIASDIDVDVLDTIEDGYLHSYVYGDMMSINNMCEFLDSVNVRYVREDITDKVLIQSIKFDDDNFSELAEKHIKSNLTIDMVLDKINIRGIESITDIDRIVLESVS
jgi:hypothetical protein